jgi:predicted DNA-binding protein
MEAKINLRINYELKEELEDLANERGTKISVLVRDILIEYINEYNYHNEENDINRPPPLIIDVSEYLDNYENSL